MLLQHATLCSQMVPTLSCQVWSYGFTTSPTGQPELDSQLSGSSSTNGSSGGSWQQQWGQQVLVPGLSPAQRECTPGVEGGTMRGIKAYVQESGLAWPTPADPLSTVTPRSSKPVLTKVYVPVLLNAQSQIPMSICLQHRCMFTRRCASASDVAPCLSAAAAVNM